MCVYGTQHVHSTFIMNDEKSDITQLAFLQFLCAYNEGAAVHRLPSSSDGVTMEEFDGKGEWKGGEKEEPIDGEEDEGAGPRFAHAGGPQCAQQ